jgi:hypothetical protein
MTKSSDLGHYSGPERRRRWLYVTRNTEYHLVDGVCVAVRDRTTGNWQLAHSALHRKLRGAVRVTRDRQAAPAPGVPRVGDALFFGGDGPDVMTSNLTAIGRPEKATVGSYPV